MAIIAAKNVGVVENAGPNNLKAFLAETIRTATAVDIGVAFVTVGGLDQVIRWLKKASGRGSVRILTGFYQCFTKPDALRKLLTLKSQFGASRFDVRVANGLHFHWKAYFLFTASKATIAIGSSNLTSDGLKSSGEMNLTLSLPRSAAQVGAIHGVFEAEWKRAKPLTATLISEYEKARPKQAGRVI